MTTLFALVKQSPECTALLGEAMTRFFEFGTAPQLEALPYATWQIVGTDPYNQLSDPAPADHITAQIDVWAESPAINRAVTKAIRRAVENDGFITYVEQGFDKESKLYRSITHYQYIEEV